LKRTSIEQNADQPAALGLLAGQIRMSAPALPWPFRLGLATPMTLLVGTAALLFGIAALTSENLWRVTPWLNVIVGTIDFHLRGRLGGVFC
jgi:hypothetical protein